MFAFQVQALKKVAACRVAPRKVVVASAKRNNAVIAAPAAAGKNMHLLHSSGELVPPSTTQGQADDPTTFGSTLTTGLGKTAGSTHVKMCL